MGAENCNPSVDKYGVGVRKLMEYGVPRGAPNRKLDRLRVQKLRRSEIGRCTSSIEADRYWLPELPPHMIFWIAMAGLK